MKALRKRKSRARFNFYVYAWPLLHSLYFIYERKIYMCMFARKNYLTVEINP